MTSLGDRARFGTEFELKEKHGGEWMFGQFCFWCGGRQVGDWIATTSLRDVLFQIEQVLRDRGRRHTDRFDRLAASDAFRLINAALFGSTDIDNSAAAEEEEWAKHNVLPAIDVFDHWRLFLLEGPDQGRLLLSQGPYGQITEVSVRVGEVDAVLASAQDALNHLYNRVRPSATL